MHEHLLVQTQLLDGPPQEVFPFFADAHNLEAITPPLLRFRVITPAPIAMHEGTLIEYRLRIHGAPVRWRTRIMEWQPPLRFVDTQISGPYALWHHTHTFEAQPDGRTLMTDTVRYAIGFGPLGRIAHRLFVRRDVERIFEHRAQVIPALLAASVAAEPAAAS
jgi:ligand-binding SRPBCC domain-containing protein